MGALISFCTLCKNCYKAQTCNSIASICGTNEERVMVASFAVNLRNIQGVMNVYTRKKKVKLLSRLQGKLSIGIT